MGKGPSRKESDQPRISIARTLMPVLAIAKGGGTAFNADKCPVTLQAKLKKSAMTVQNVQVNLKRNDVRYDILVGETLVGTMNITLSKTITGCSELGIRYRGKIVVENKYIYARFQRTT